MKRPSNISGWDEYYRSSDIQAEQQAAQAKAAAKPDNSPVDWWLLTLPPGDKLRAEARKQHFNVEPAKTGE